MTTNGKIETINYRAAMPDEAPIVEAFWLENGVDATPGWATVVAERDERIIGAVSARADEENLIVGPLVVEKDAGRYVALRLIEKLELGLIGLGAKGYIFRMPPNLADSPWQLIILALANRGLVMDIGDDENGDKWYLRSFDKTFAAQAKQEMNNGTI